MDFSVNVRTVLGQGCFGAVHPGTLGYRPVAAKAYFWDASQMENEARLLKLCDHENVIKCYGVMNFKGISYLVMDLAGAGTLYSNLRLNQFSVKQKILLVQQLSSGLEHIHSRKIVHNDMKVENLFFKSVILPHIVIGDFGNSKLHFECCQNTPCVTEYTRERDVQLLAFVTWQIFQDRAFGDHKRKGIVRDVLRYGLPVNIFTEITWRNAIIYSFADDPALRPTASDFGAAFS